MMSHKLADNWLIDINNLFERRVEENGDLLFTTGDKSVRVVVWTDPNKTKDEIYTEYKNMIATRDQSKSSTLEQFDFSTADVAKTGYRIQESEGERTYSVIYGFSINGHEIIQTALYVDDEADLNWALETWKSIRLAKDQS